MTNNHPDNSHAPGTLIGCQDCDNINENRAQEERKEILGKVHAAGYDRAKLSDIVWREGEWTIDGMPWEEWYAAHTME
jgi:hypothetical protein